VRQRSPKAWRSTTTRKPQRERSKPRTGPARRSQPPQFRPRLPMASSPHSCPPHTFMTKMSPQLQFTVSESIATRRDTPSGAMTAMHQPRLRVRRASRGWHTVHLCCAWGRAPRRRYAASLAGCSFRLLAEASDARGELLLPRAKHQPPPSSRRSLSEGPLSAGASAALSRSSSCSSRRRSARSRSRSPGSRRWICGG
jgi:hypothetical protein